MKKTFYAVTLIFIVLVVPESLWANQETKDTNETKYMTKLGIGVPGLVQPSLEVFLNDTYSIEGGIGKAPLNMVYTGIARWRPEKTRFMNDKLHLAFGLEVNFLPEADLWKRAMWLGGPFADFHYERKLEENQAWAVGIRSTWGLGYKFNPPWKEEGYMAVAEDTGELIAQDNSEFFPFIPLISLYAGYKF